MAQTPDQSETSTANLALSLLRQPPLVDLATDTFKSARVMRLWFGPERDALLRLYPWNFAEKLAQLAADTETPQFGASYYYKLPADWLRLRRVVGASRHRPAKVEGRRIRTSLGPPLQIVYTARVTDVQQWDPLFVQALAVALANRAAPEIAKDERISREYERQVQNALAAAFPVDAQEGEEEEPDDIQAGYTWAGAYL